MRDVGIKRSDVKCDRYGIVGKCVDCVHVGKFVKEISSVFNVRRNSTNYRFKVVVNKLRDMFCGVVVRRNYGPFTTLSFFMSLLWFATLCPFLCPCFGLPHFGNLLFLVLLPGDVVA